MTGIYIHIPFCKRKCPYCSFYSVVYDKETADAYVCALIRNIRRYKDKRISADTVYFGGGTPSLLEAYQISEILKAVKESFELSDTAEITVEANPSSVDFSKLKDYLNAGVNRISFGVQSACDSELSALGRLHDYETAKNAVELAKKAGFDNISCDLMIGTPRQTLETLLESAGEILSLPVCHISAYMLKIEEGTLFDCDWVKDNVADEDTVCEMYENLIRILKINGFEQYEISNFAKNGLVSRHNIKYWEGESYIGFGPSAHSYFDSKRYFVPSDVYEYIAGDYQEEIVEEESVDKAEEYVMLSLRLSRGISYSKYEELGGDVNRLLEKAGIFKGTDLIETSQTGMRLTPKGFLVSNSIIAELLC